MKKLILLLLLITQISFCQKDDQLFEKAEILLKNKEYQEAIKLFDKVLELNPDYVGASVNLGISKSNLQEYESALKHYKKAIALDSLNTLSYFNIANIYVDLEDFEKSITYYNKALQSAKNAINPESNRLILKRIFVREISPFQVSIDKILYFRGSTFYDLKQYELALKDFLSISENSHTKDSQFMLASTLLKLNRNKKACSELNKAIILGSKIAIEIKKRNCI